MELHSTPVLGLAWQCCRPSRNFLQEGKSRNQATVQVKHLSLLFRYILLPRQKERKPGMCKLSLQETLSRSWA